MSLVVVDYGRGNLFSLCEALRQVGADYTLESDPAAVERASRIILPGVGAFGDCMQGLRERGLIEPVVRAVRERGVPFLGICVGMQIMATRGEEFGDHPGLGLIEGVVRRLPDPVDPAGRLRVPNVGWREIAPRADDPVLGELPGGTMTYFLHSYAFEAENSADVAASFDFNGRRVTGAVRRDNMHGFQFHPEKSGPAGLDILHRFVTMPGRVQ